VSVYIDFCNGNFLGPTETSPTHIIGQRVAARAIFHCTNTELSAALYKHQDLLHIFDFNTVMEAIRSMHPTGVCAILLILDEFNYMINRDPKIGDSIIQIIGRFMREFCNKKTTVLFPVIAGTVEGQTNPIVVRSGYHKQHVSLPPLSYESIEEIFKAYLPVSRHKWLDFIPFRRALLLMCSNPGALNTVLTSLAAKGDEPSLQNVQAVVHSLQQVLMAKASHVSIKFCLPALMLCADYGNASRRRRLQGFITIRFGWHSFLID